MQVLRLLARRRGAAATTITAPTAAPEPLGDSKAVDAEEYDDDGDDDDEGSLFELDLSVRASSSSAGSAASSGSSTSDDDASSLTDLDFVISLHRSRSASPSFHLPAPPLPDLKPGSGVGLRTLSFAGASTRNAALCGGRRSSFARSSGAGGVSARSLRLFMESPLAADDDQDRQPQPRRAPSGDVIRRYLTKISTRLRRSVRARRSGGEGGLRRLRKSRSASAAVTTTTTTTASRRDDTMAEKQDGIAGAIAHCKESLHRASLSMSPSECGLPRSRSDPGNRQAS